VYHTESDGEFLILIHVLFISYYLRLVSDAAEGLPAWRYHHRYVSTGGEAMKYTPGI